ncbi:hypothetical protein [Nocardioides alkalitolerans]|uniref:hypothetical protein n=1 Tax=Nocardioides alkalitolerans TaxID=281714 RepID=UPI00041719E6|nr:hypothetical protein [Nocardioides alkalitolerans]
MSTTAPERPRPTPTGGGTGRWTARWAGLGRPDRILLGLVGAHVLVKLSAFLLVGTSPLHGDEAAYVNGGMALSNLLRDLGSLTTPDTAELSQNVVASGWFMPGISLLLTPLYLLVPDADVGLMRAYVGIITSVVLLVAALRVRRVLGPGFAGALLVMPGLVPMWAAFSMATWGDLFAGLLIVLLLVRLVELSRLLRAGTAPSLGDGVRLGLLCIAVVYFRSSASLLVAGLGVLTLVAALALLRGRERVRAVLSSALAGVAFLAVLAPWSYVASEALDGPVLTTTSVPTVLANTFGKRQEVCFGECDPGSTIWFSPLRYSRETGAVSGHTEAEVADQMSAYARRDVTPSSYSADVLHNLGAYVWDPPRFYRWLDAPAGPLRAVSAVVTWTMVWVAFLVGIALLFTIVRRPRDAQVVSVLLTVSLGSLLTQPFVHVAGPRYWTTAAPVLGLAAALLWQERVRRRTAAAVPAAAPADEHAGLPEERHHLDEVWGRWLTGLQVVLAAATALVAVGLVALALPTYLG